MPFLSVPLQSLGKLSGIPWERCQFFSGPYLSAVFSVRRMGFILVIFSYVEFRKNTTTHARIKPIDVPARPLPGLTRLALLQTRICTSDFQALLLVVTSMLELAAQSRSFLKPQSIENTECSPIGTLVYATHELFFRHTFFVEEAT